MRGSPWLRVLWWTAVTVIPSATIPAARPCLRSMLGMWSTEEVKASL